MQVINSAELSDLLKITRRQANRILRTVNEELQREGYIVLNTRPLKAPRHQVLKRLGLSEGNDEKVR
jgi:hypothetical protein